MRITTVMLVLSSSVLLCAQEPVSDAPAPKPAVVGKSYTVTTGTKIPLSMINSVSTKHTAEGDRIYLETVFPILVDGKIVIPPGSYVAGTVTELKRQVGNHLRP